MKRSAQPLPSGARTNAGELSVPRKRSSFWKSWAMYWLPWSCRTARPRAMPCANPPKWRRTPWRSGSSASKQSARPLAWMPTHSAEQWSTATNTAAWPSPVIVVVRSVPAVRAASRLESVGETLRAALNALATVAPDWLVQHADAEWPDRYGRPFEECRLPKGEGPRKVLGEQIGRDGHRLLAAAYDPSAPSWLRALPAVQTLRRAWVNQFYLEDDRITWCDRAELPPASLRFDNPYDPDARYGNKRSTTWNGYKAHFTETCDADGPHLVIHVETTPAPVSDVAMTAPVHEALRAKDLLPGTHLVDAGYVDADLLIDAQAAHGIELVGPVRPDTSWQAQAGQGYAVSVFAVDWEAKTVTCPQGHRSVDWVVTRDPWGTGTVHVGFAKATCRACPSRPLCTRAKAAPRALTLRREGRHEAIQAMRKRQDTPEWRALYGARAGIEGCLSQGVRLCGLRRSRYVGLAKTHLQHVATAAALHVARLDAWLRGRPRAATRTSRFVQLMAA